MLGAIKIRVPRPRFQGRSVEFAKISIYLSIYLSIFVYMKNVTTYFTKLSASFLSNTLEQWYLLNSDDLLQFAACVDVKNEGFVDDFLQVEVSWNGGTPSYHPF